MRKVVLIALAVLLLPAVASATPLVDIMVPEIGDMKRVQLVTGDAAQAEVDKLHGKALPAEESVVARYARPADVASGRPAEVWVSRVESEQEARRQVGVMVHKMYENPRSPFKNPKRSDFAGNAVYVFEGMGQKHLIWFKDDLVFWISVAAEGQDVMLAEFCK